MKITKMQVYFGVLSRMHAVVFGPQGDLSLL